MGADLFAPSDIPRMVPVGDVRGLDLTAEEGFLLSRIDGRVNVGALLSMVAWDREKTLQLLESLLRKHLLNFDRAEIANRVFGTGNVEAPSASGDGSQEGSANPGLSIRLTAVAEHPPTFTIDPSTIEKVPDLEPNRCIEILTWSRKVAEAENLYQMFEIPLGADAKSVKRQYRQMAMSFHPDKFFRKEIGGYRHAIDTAWKRVQEGYELLSEPDKKTLYDAEVAAKARSRPKSLEAGTSGSGSKVPSSAPAGSSPRPPGKPAFSKDAAPWDEKPARERTSRPHLESSVERKLKAEVGERLTKAKRHFDQAQKDFSDGKFSSADSNVKLAIQFDERNPAYKTWHDSNRKKLEEGIVGAMLQKAEMSESSGNLKGAADDYEKALALFPDNVQANMGFGKLIAARGDDPRRARECLQKGLNVKPNDLGALLAMCRVLRETGSVKNAQRYIEKAKEIAPKDPRVAEEAKEIKKASK